MASFPHPRIAARSAAFRPAGQRARVAAAAMLIAVLAGCATPDTHRQAEQINRPADRPPVIIVMPIDVELSQLTAGGLQEPHAEWTDSALRHMRGALDEQARLRGVKLVDYAPDGGAPADRETAIDLVKLHRAVGGSVMLHQYMPTFALPSKQGRFDWSLGPSAQAIARMHGADYALFVFVRDSYATAGRQAVMIVGALLGVGVPGGAQVGFASVVDLKTGDIVWFNRLVRPSGDLRTPAAAAETMQVLVSDAMK